MGNSQSIPHHIVLHLSTDHHEPMSPTADRKTAAASTTADVKDAKTFADLVKAATAAFGAPPSDHHFCFYAANNSEITNDKQLAQTWQDALKVVQASSSQQQHGDANNDFACHVDVTIESSLSSSKSDNAADGENSADHSKQKLREYQTLEFDLPEFSKAERPFNASFVAANANNNEDDKKTTTRAEGGENAPPPAAAPPSIPPCDVLFIGAGPVGLWTAVQLKIRAPHLNVVMLEKYAVFQRKHVVLLNARSLWFMPSDKRLKQFAKNLPHAIRTNDLEDRLSKLAQEIGIQVIIEAVTDVAIVVEKYKPLCVVGSDGSHSIVRKKFMTHGNAAATTTTTTNDQSSSKDTSLDVDDIVDNTVTVKYEILKNAEMLSPIDLYKVQKILPFKQPLGFFEHVSTKYKEKSSGTETTTTTTTSTSSSSSPEKPSSASSSTAQASTAPAVLIISGVPTYAMETVKGATFRDPVRIDGRDDNAKAKWLKMHPYLRAAVSGYFRAKELVKDEIRDVASVAISPVPLRVYRAKWFAEVVEIEDKNNNVNNKKKIKIPAFLVGDAATGMPFFRALNNGFYAGSRLATTLASALDAPESVRIAHDSSTTTAAAEKIQSNLKSAVNQYHMYMLLLSSTEIMRARAAAAALLIGRELVSLQGQSPLQAISFSAEKEKEILSVMNEQMMLIKETVAPVVASTAEKK